MSKNSFSKAERLKSVSLISKLFLEGKTLFKYPIKIVYIPLDKSNYPVHFGVSVSKKRFKKAVQRNRIKRLLKEAYRTQKEPLWKVIKQKNKNSYAVMAIFVGNEELPLSIIGKSMKHLLKMLEKQI